MNSPPLRIAHAVCMLIPLSTCIRRAAIAPVLDTQGVRADVQQAAGESPAEKAGGS